MEWIAWILALVHIDILLIHLLSLIRMLHSNKTHNQFQFTLNLINLTNFLKLEDHKDRTWTKFLSNLTYYQSKNLEVRMINLYLRRSKGLCQSERKLLQEIRPTQCNNIWIKFLANLPLFKGKIKVDKQMFLAQLRITHLGVSMKGIKCSHIGRHN